MLENLQRAALILRPLKIPALAGSFASLAVVVALVLRGGPRDDDRILIPALVVFLLLVSLYLLVAGFAAIPPRPLPEDGFRRRLVIRFYRLVFWLIGILFLVTSLVVVSLTSKMIGIWLRDY